MSLLLYLLAILSLLQVPFKMPAGNASVRCRPCFAMQGSAFQPSGIAVGIFRFKTQSLIHTGVEPAPPRSETECSPTELMQIEENAVCVFMYSVIQDAVCGSELT